MNNQNKKDFLKPEQNIYPKEVEGLDKVSLDLDKTNSNTPMLNFDDIQEITRAAKRKNKKKHHFERFF